MPGIFLAFNSASLAERRTSLYHTLVKAGLQVFPSDTRYNPEHEHISENLHAADYSLHILGLEYGDPVNGGQSVEELQYHKAITRLRETPGFKVFIWFPHAIAEITDQKQNEFISGIRNNISHGVFFSNIPSPIQLVDDLRINVAKVEKVNFDVKETDVFLVYNQLDDHEASEIMDMLSDIIPVEKVNIIQDSELDYSELCAQQIGKSKLAVVYFKESAEWALSFTQQIWKKVGGASSHTPILLIGDEDPESNSNKKFKAPKVVSLIVAGELIPLEIKVQYDKIIQAVT